MTRTETIRTRLTTHFQRELGHTTVCPSKKTWLAYPLPPRFRFGWMPPVMQSDNADEMQLVVSFCPELMAEMTNFLDDEEFETYLTIVETFVDAHIYNHGEPIGDINRGVEDQFYDQAPALLALLSLVEAHALDSGIVGTPT